MLPILSAHLHIEQQRSRTFFLVQWPLEAASWQLAPRSANACPTSRALASTHSFVPGSAVGAAHGGGVCLPGTLVHVGLGHRLSAFSPFDGHEPQLSGHSLHSFLTEQRQASILACLQVAPFLPNASSISGSVASLQGAGGSVVFLGGGVHFGGGVGHRCAGVSVRTHVSIVQILGRVVRGQQPSTYSFGQTQRSSKVFSGSHTISEGP